MAVAHSLLRQLCEQEEDPACIVGKLNGEACRNNESGVFLTLFLGVLDLTSGRLRYCNAGHEHPLFIRDTVEELPALANVPVGAFNDFEYRGQETDVAPGAVLFLFTDGVSEAMDINRQQYGRKRLRAFLSGCSRQPDALVHAVGDSVRTFVGTAGQSDDITMLAIRYREEKDKNR